MLRDDSIINGLQCRTFASDLLNVFKFTRGYLQHMHGLFYTIPILYFCLDLERFVGFSCRSNIGRKTITHRISVCAAKTVPVKTTKRYDFVSARNPIWYSVNLHCVHTKL